MSPYLCVSGQIHRFFMPCSFQCIFSYLSNVYVIFLPYSYHTHPIYPILITLSMPYFLPYPLHICGIVVVYSSHIYPIIYINFTSCYLPCSLDIYPLLLYYIILYLLIFISYLSPYPSHGLSIFHNHSITLCTYNYLAVLCCW